MSRLVSLRVRGLVVAVVAGSLLLGVPAAAAASPASGASVAAGPVRPAAGPLSAVTVPPSGAGGSWWFTSWRIREVWAAGARGQGVTVAVIDSGVNPVPELRGVLDRGTDFAGGDGRSDSDGHGTRMALFVAGQGGQRDLVGVAPQARILPVTYPGGDVGPSIRWAVDHGARVVNLSLGGYHSCSDPEAEAVRYALDRGAVVVAGTGNKADRVAVTASPANCPGVLGVGAVDDQGRPWADTEVSAVTDVAAPGVGMRGIDAEGRLGVGSGTSDASALVSAAVALVWSKYPELTNRQVVARLLATLRDTGAPGRDDRTGYGIVRPYQAITADVPADAPNVVFDEVPEAEPAASASALPTPSGSAAPAAPDSSSTGSGLPSDLLRWVLLTGLVVIGGGLVVVVLVVVLTGRRRASAR